MDARRRGRGALARLGAVGALIAVPLVGIGPAGPAVAAEDTTIEVVTALPSGRIADTDQFTVRLSEDGTALASGTTTGAGSTVDAGTGTTGAVVVDPALEYALDELAAGTTDLGRYRATIACVDAEGLTGDLPDGAPLGEPFLLSPAEGSTITCTIANVPVAPTLSLAKAFGSPRVEDTDQFYVAISRASIIVADGLTAGAGSTVDPGSGTTGAYAATAGTTYELHELAQGTADSADYDATIDCVDANGFQTGLPDDAALEAGGALPITPVAGAAIACLITNTVAPSDPTLRVVKQLGGDRIDDTDEFTVEIDGGTGPLGSSTTSGSGAIIDAGTGDTGVVTLAPGAPVVVDEEEAGTTDLDRYDATISCTDANGLQDGLPDGTALDPDGFELALTAGAAVTCTITNTAVPPDTTIEVVKALGSARAEPTDQFGVVIEGPNGFVAGGATTGTGSTVDPGTGTTGPVVVEPLFGYQVGETGQGDTDLFRYDATVDCVDANGLQTGLPDDAAYPGPFTIEPTLGAEITCTITNTARPVTSIEVVKELGAPRAEDTDQFTVQLTEDDTVVASATTTGTGVELGGNTTGAVEVTAGTAYEVGEVAAGGTDLDRYDALIDCVDANGLQAGLPEDQPYTGPITVEPTLGAAITCTITNEAARADITVTKALGGPRVVALDQFTVSITEPGGFGLSSTTTGAGATVDPGSGTLTWFGAASFVTYAIAEEAGYPGATLANYDATITCVDEAGYHDDLPTDALLVGELLLRPEAGADITCTITNTPAPTFIRLAKELGSERVRPDDQFTVQLRDGDQVVLTTTTYGAGDEIVGDTGRAGPWFATPGTAYEVSEVAAGTTDLSLYAATIDCVDANGLQAGLPDDAPYTGPVTIEPTRGADITCTITNTAVAPTIELAAAFGTERARPGDQVTVGIGGPSETTARITPGPDGPVVSDPTHATTEGTGSAVVPGTGTTGPFTAVAGTTFVLGETGAGTTDLAVYTGTLTCTDAAGLQPGLPTDAAYTGPVELAPVAGARISCTITNRVATAVVEDASILKELLGTTPVGADQVEVAYRLTVENLGTGPITYDLDDTLLFGDGITTTSATVANTTPGDIAVAADWDGVDQPRIVSAQLLGAGEVHVFSVTVRVRVEATATASAIDCEADPGETGTGATNSATLGSATSDAEATVAVCGAVERRTSVGPIGPVVGVGPDRPASPGTGVLARTGGSLGLLTTIGLALLAVGTVMTVEWKRPRRRATDPRFRHRLASLLDRTP